MNRKLFSLFHHSVNLIRVFIGIVRRLPCELNIYCTSTTAESRAKNWYQ